MKFDEYTALTEIKDGKLLSDFHNEDYEDEDLHLPTSLMILAALTYHKKDGYREIPESRWSPRAAMLAVEKNFRALDVIPEESKFQAVPSIILASQKVTRKDLSDFLAVINRQPLSVLKKCAKVSPGILRFYGPDNRKAAAPAKPNNSRQTPAMEPMPERTEEGYSLDFSSAPELSDPDYCSAESFLALPVSEQTKECLDTVLSYTDDLPADFIKRLSVPNRNAAFYTKAGDTEKSAYWKERIIPYLGLSVCQEIAAKHPEGSLETKSYLTKEGVDAFWERKRENSTGKQMAEWFCKFPKEVLDSSMLDNLAVSEEVLQHAPEICKGTDAANKFLDRNPAAILRLPDYQTQTRLLRAGVPLNAKNIEKVADEDLRKKIALALGIRLAEAAIPA